MDYKDIGLRIKNHRQIQGISQRQLADQIGTTWEMISRYETGKSSPLSRIDRIAKALKVPVYRLLQEDGVADGGPSYQRNLVPLIDKTFTDLQSAIDKTKGYYLAPDWISQKFNRVFAIETGLLKIKTTQIENSGLLFAIQEQPEAKSDLVIAKLDGEIFVTNIASLHKGTKVLATIVAWEKRFR